MTCWVRKSSAERLGSCLVLLPRQPDVALLPNASRQIPTGNVHGFDRRAVANEICDQRQRDVDSPGPMSLVFSLGLIRVTGRVASREDETPSGRVVHHAVPAPNRG